MVMRIGMLGFNEGNGHPFSYSAIINGYDERALRVAGWSVIADYLACEPQSAYADLGARVTCAWGPDSTATRDLQRACGVDDIVDSPDEMLGQIDAAIIARDDWMCHRALAQPFLNAGLPVFVDKPLSLLPDELKVFRPHLESGLLASWSGLRYAPELEQVIIDGQVAALRATSVECWDRYAIHVVEPALSLLTSTPYAATAFRARHDAVTFEMEDQRLLYVDVLGVGSRAGYHLELVSAAGVKHVKLNDRFNAFKRSLMAFIRMVREESPVVGADQTINVLRAIIAGRMALDEDRRVLLSEVAV